MLEKIKMLLGRSDVDDIDDLITVLISLCKDEAIIYCRLDEYDSKMDGAIIQMVIERYNRMGSEGATSQTSSGVAMTYDSFYSDKVRRLLNKFRRIKTV